MGKLLKIITFSLVETAALATWLATKNFALRNLILSVGLSIEHWFSHNTNKNKSLINIKGVPFGKIIGFSVSEALIWAIWLPISAALGFVGGAIFLTLALIPQHKVELNVVEGRPTFEKLFSGRTVTISIIEGVGGQIWLELANRATNILEQIAAVVVLFIVMFVEHEFQAAEIENR